MERERERERGERERDRDRDRDRERDRDRDRRVTWTAFAILAMFRTVNGIRKVMQFLLILFLRWF